MINFFRGWSQPALSPGQQGQGYSSHNNTIMALALGALALFSANAFDRTNPGLAVILRCVAGGIGLLWLFDRCCPTSTRPHHGHYVVTPAPVVVNAAPPPVNSHWNWWPSWLNMNQIRAAPVYRAQRPIVQVNPTPYHPPQQAHTNYSHVGPQVGLPQAYPTYGGAFPTVHRAPAQPDPRPIYQAPLNRGPIQAIPQQGGFQKGQVAHMQGGNPSHQGNQRPIFQAATQRI